MERIEAFTQDGKNFLYFDMSYLKTNDEFIKIIEASKPLIMTYEESSLYTITNIEGIMFDTKTKKIVAEWTTFNKPYVKYGAIIGMDSIKQIMVNAVFALSRRKNMVFASTKEKAIEWLRER